jgi:hypothetical protein
LTSTPSREDVGEEAAVLVGLGLAGLLELELDLAPLDQPLQRRGRAP